MPALIDEAEIVGDGLDSDASVAAWLRARIVGGEFDAEDRPRPGTSCWLCVHAQAACAAEDVDLHRHSCPAKGMVGEYALCAACGAGEICEQTLAVMRRMQPSDGVEGLEQEVNLPGPVRQVPQDVAAELEWRRCAEPIEPHSWAKVKESLSVDNLRRVKRCTGCGGKMWYLSAGSVCRTCYRAPVEARESEDVTMAGGRTSRISDEIREKVKAEFGTMSNEALGRKYGISGVTVGAICGRKRREQQAAARAAKALDRMFGALGLEAKARLIQHVLLEGAGA